MDGRLPCLAATQHGPPTPYAVVLLNYMLFPPLLGDFGSASTWERHSGRARTKILERELPLTDLPEGSSESCFERAAPVRGTWGGQTVVRNASRGPPAGSAA